MKSLLKFFIYAFAIAWIAINVAAFLFLCHAAGDKNVPFDLFWMYVYITIIFSLTTLLLYGIIVSIMILAVLVEMAAGTKKGGPAGDGEDCKDVGDDGDGGELPGVSVIIPFRNEERNLGALLESLKNQSYKGATEVILVNDQSDDNGADVINEFCQRNDDMSVKIIDLQLSDDVKLTSKQQALDLGVEQSSHPLLAFTDADMILAPNWIEALVSTRISTAAALVFGHTSIINPETRKSLFTLFESYQLEFLFSFAYIFSKLGLTGSCMGNNVLIAKEAYGLCGGQRGVGYSIVEDRALLELVRRKGLLAVPSEPFTVTARTYPAQSKKQFISQMARWARGGLRPGGGLFIAGFLLLAQNIALPVIAASGGITLGGPGLICAANFLLTWIFLALAFKKIGSPAPKWLFPAYYIFMMAETAVFGFLLIFRPKINWKNRKLRA
jgi:cellulose synthase/poly-beta-1,6-N-acetylglucosamine synthase-like glycosyltransferase